MKKLNQSGEFNFLLLGLVLAILAMIGTSVLSVMYYNKFVEQRDKNQPIIEAAVEKAKEEQKTALESDFREQEKQPNKTYTAPATFGSVKFSYPKTWSSYVRQGSALEFYAHPNFVPSEGVNYALRMSVTNKQFSSVVGDYDSKVKKGELKSSAVNFAGVNGTRLDGTFSKEQSGSMVLIPIRDKTLQVWTETEDFKGDFDNIILKSLTFSP